MWTGMLGAALLATSAPALAAVQALQATEACQCPMHRMPAAPSVRVPCCCERPTAPAPVAPTTAALAADGGQTPHAAPPALATVDAWALTRTDVLACPYTPAPPRGPPLFLLVSSLRR